MMSPRSTGRYGSSQLVNLLEGAYTCLLNSRKSPTSSVCSMLSEGISSGCSTNVSRNSATTTVRNSEAKAGGRGGKCGRRCANRDSCPPGISAGMLAGVLIAPFIPPLSRPAHLLRAHLLGPLLQAGQDYRACRAPAAPHPARRAFWCCPILAPAAFRARRLPSFARWLLETTPL